MTERKESKIVINHPDTGEVLDDEVSDLITSYNSDPRNVANSSTGITKILKGRALASPYEDTLVKDREELKNLGLKAD